jgi:hypothetical protein
MKSTRHLLLALAAAGIVVTGLGFAIEAEGFAGNSIAGLSSLLLSVVLAVGLIDQMLRRKRREQWSAVRDEMSRAICEAILDMAWSFALVVPDNMGFAETVANERDSFASPRIWRALCDLVEAATVDTDSLAAQLAPHLASTRVLYDQTAGVVASFRSEMTTRDAVMGDEPKLVEALLAMERAERGWRSQLEMVEREGAPDRLAWASATAALRAGSEVYGYFVTSS